MRFARPWTAAEDAVLCGCYLRDGVHRLAGRLNRTPQAVRARAHKLGLAARRRRWREWEDDIIRKAYAGPPQRAGATAARRLTHRALASIYKRAECLGLTAPVEWTRREDNILRRAWDEGEGAANRAHARLRRRTVYALRSRAKRLGLHVRGAAPCWTPAEDAIVRREWARGSLGAVDRVRAELPRRSRKAIAGRGQKLCPGAPRRYAKRASAARKAAWAARSMPAFVAGGTAPPV